MISFIHKGNFSVTKNYFNRLLDKVKLSDLDKYGKKGVEALKAATPVDSGLTANSWSYEIIRSREKIAIIWKNSNINNGVPIAIILQYGHATRNGGFVQGRDYINPAIRPIFEEIAKESWNEVIDV